MSFQFEKSSIGDKIILDSGIVALMSLLQPWTKLGNLSELCRITIGISDYAWIPFILGWGLSVCMLFKPLKFSIAVSGKPLNAKFLIALTGALIALIWGIVYIICARAVNTYTGESANISSWGVYLFCLSALALAAGILLSNDIIKIGNSANLTGNGTDSSSKTE